MELKGIDNMSITDIAKEIERGGKFVMYTYCISILVMTFRRASAIYFVKSHEMPLKHGWPFLLISTTFGWWGIPWGPIYTIQSIYKAFAGTNVTTEVVQSLTQALDSKGTV